MFKWTDESIVEEVEELIEKMEKLEGDAVALEKGLRACELRSKIFKWKIGLAKPLY